MATPSFLQLPIDPAEGFPQAFRLSLADVVYQFRLYANVSEQVVESLPDEPVDLPIVGAFLVLSVAREAPSGLTTILRRKLVAGVSYEAGELMLTFRTMRLDRRNLNGLGSFGSEVVGGVALR
jgi:hypothetical protein